MSIAIRDPPPVAAPPKLWDVSLWKYDAVMGVNGLNACGWYVAIFKWLLEWRFSLGRSGCSVLPPGGFRDPVCTWVVVPASYQPSYHRTELEHFTGRALLYGRAAYGRPRTRARILLMKPGGLQ